RPRRPQASLPAQNEPPRPGGIASWGIDCGHRHLVPFVSPSVCVCGNGRARTALPLVADPADRPGHLVDLGNQAETEVKESSKTQAPNQKGVIDRSARMSR